MALYIQVIFVAACLTSASCQDPGCDYYKKIQPGETVYASSPNYPRNYTGGVTCRWIVSCPDAHCRANCYDIALPSSPQCSGDKLLISKSGSPQFQDYETFCGTSSTTVTSDDSDISIALVTSSTSRGGRFLCEITSFCTCGYKKTNHIVGGTETGVNEYPMMTALKNVNTNSFYCGGAIINKKYVLTAAHCIPNDTDVNDIAVVVGEHDVDRVDDTQATREYSVARYLVHPKYNAANNDYDAALLVLSKDIKFSDRVGPVCLPFKFVNKTFAREKVTVLGWGTLSFGGPTSETLQKATLDVISDESCRQKQNVTTQQMCTYTEGKDTCQMDSGGPALYTDSATGLLHCVGIISYGNFCGVSTASVDTRVTKMLPWISENTPGVYYCRK